MFRRNFTFPQENKNAVTVTLPEDITCVCLGEHDIGAFAANIKCHICHKLCESLDMLNKHIAPEDFRGGGTTLKILQINLSFQERKQLELEIWLALEISWTNTINYLEILYRANSVLRIALLRSMRG